MVRVSDVGMPGTAFEALVLHVSPNRRRAGPSPWFRLATPSGPTPVRTDLIWWFPRVNLLGAGTAGYRGLPTTDAATPDYR